MFNDPIAVQFFDYFQREYKFNSIVETGTYYGNGTLNLSKYRDYVATIEIDKETRDKALKNFKDNGYTISSPKEPFDLVICSNGQKIIYSLLGNSPEVLNVILSRKTIGGPFLFYLDAHWQEYFPLLDELKSIAKNKLSDSSIIIHDFKVPTKDFGYDRYSSTYKPIELSFDYIKHDLAQINKNYIIFCNEEAEGNKRGILYVVPPDDKPSPRWKRVNNG